jgi:hypothetical protein
VEENGQKFYANPKQKPPSEECTDIAPDDRYTCEQQVSLWQRWSAAWKPSSPAISVFNVLPLTERIHA